MPARPGISPHFRGRQNKHIAEPIQKLAHDVTARPQVALREDIFFEDVVWQEQALVAQFLQENLIKSSTLITCV